MDKPFTNGAGFRMPSMHSFFLQLCQHGGPSVAISSVASTENDHPMLRITCNEHEIR